ncbi:uncharacterized protein C8Q71DRAFT_862749 [Rhodofomes roseus]|uniref:Uncharacterized protein n=1 Tax=Rhodofomes roseus TaxID=34475 RepID=A0ABQ8K0I5_9APHY|nr:uncharacterized protein C8Q71DRAFT_862749 [Rhodofomes roseus]KAH9830165.1 hypothetical protein C8Q71DRAFT_862749 [Rhodofomes roseus]
MCTARPSSVLAPYQHSHLVPAPFSAQSTSLVRPCALAVTLALSLSRWCLPSRLCLRAARSTDAYLVPPEEESLVENLRIFDKYSVSPPTTYLGAEFKEEFNKPNVTYRQVNLTVASLAAIHDSGSTVHEPSAHERAKYATSQKISTSPPQASPDRPSISRARTW